MRQHLQQLERLGVELVCPDAPDLCDDAAVDRLYAVWDAPRQPPPYCRWWDASDDGRVYHGWEQTRELVAPILERAPLGIIGFSQGAILATALAALAQHGQLPPIAYVILIAGRPPRADLITPFLGEPIRIPSLHVWGTNDVMARDSCPDLVERFDAGQREVVTWDGTHHIPSQGPASAAIEQLIRRFS